MIAVSGPAAAFIAAGRRSDGSWTLVLTTTPPVGSYALTITETAAGYSNSPRATALTVFVTADSASPIVTDLSGSPADLLASLKAEPDGQPLLAHSLDPGDRRPITVSFANVIPEGKTIGTIENEGFGDADGADGMRLATGALRTALDPANKLLRFNSYCDPAFQQLAAFDGDGKIVSPKFRITLVSDDQAKTNPLNEALDFSVPHTRKQH